MLSCIRHCDSTASMGNICLCVSVSSYMSIIYLPSSLVLPSGNSRRPEITQTNLVDIYLFHGDSQAEIYHWHNIMNPVDQSGSITAQVNDTWFGSQATSWNGQNLSYPYYWVITRSDATLDGSEIPQSTFTAVRKYQIFVPCLEIGVDVVQRQHTPIQFFLLWLLLPQRPQRPRPKPRQPTPTLQVVQGTFNRA
jgi:hypothetical protein